MAVAVLLLDPLILVFATGPADNAAGGNRLPRRGRALPVDTAESTPTQGKTDGVEGYAVD